VSVKPLLMFGAVFFAASAFAQAPLGTVGNVQGLVTVTDGATGGTVAPGSPITNGMRFVTTSSGSVTLQLNNGCSVTVQPNQAVTVLQSMTCQELTAAVQPVGAAGVAAGAGGAFGAGGAGAGLMGVSALALAGFAANRAIVRNPSLSGQ
jgi:hypothetical protein